MWGLISWFFSFNPLVYMSVLCGYHTVLINIAWQVSFGTGEVWALQFDSSFSDWFSYSDPWRFHMLLGWAFLFLQKVLWDFDKDYIGSVDNLASIVILTISSLPIYDHRISFHLFMSSLVLSAMFCSFQCIACLGYIVDLVPGHFNKVSITIKRVRWIFSFPSPYKIYVNTIV